jgi:ribonuclease VapC
VEGDEAEPVGTEKQHGKGNGRGVSHSLIDLMVNAVAKERDEQLLCTGKGFAATDVEIHGASLGFSGGCGAI